ncbi:hypothetical protein EDF66_12012 [Sphingobacterium sp. JUb20]|nr:hypothetical protein [Sphingobacterium sp. JUb21]TCQ96787.1 hypothetical protein EDF66_12012 [Sphingobacterium sp. JUb20]
MLYIYLSLYYEKNYTKSIRLSISIVFFGDVISSMLER